MSPAQRVIWPARSKPSAAVELRGRRIRGRPGSGRAVARRPGRRRRPRRRARRPPGSPATAATPREAGAAPAAADAWSVSSSDVAETHATAGSLEQGLELGARRRHLGRGHQPRLLERVDDRPRVGVGEAHPVIGSLIELGPEVAGLREGPSLRGVHRVAEGVLGPGDEEVPDHAGGRAAPIHAGSRRPRTSGGARAPRRPRPPSRSPRSAACGSVAAMTTAPSASSVKVSDEEAGLLAEPRLDVVLVGEARVARPPAPCRAARRRRPPDHPWPEAWRARIRAPPCGRPRGEPRPRRTAARRQASRSRDPARPAADEPPPSPPQPASTATSGSSATEIGRVRRRFTRPDTYSTVTVFARLRGWSTFRPLSRATW